jgi:hypothetical protein
VPAEYVAFNCREDCTHVGYHVFITAKLRLSLTMGGAATLLASQD